MWSLRQWWSGKQDSEEREGKVYLLTNYSPYLHTVYEPDYVPIEDSFASAQRRRFWEFISLFYHSHSGVNSLSAQDAEDAANRFAFLRGHHESNSIRTTKYSLFSFLPRVLFFQLTRVGNLIFLAVSFLQLIEDVSDSNGIPTYLIPLIFVIAVCMGREMASDLVRWRSDESVNKQPVHVFRGGVLKKMRLCDLHVGDIVKVHAYESFPSDMVLLSCSDEQGVCNIETKNVDGESNVKYKHVIPELAELFRNDEDAARTQIKLICEPPNDSLSSFSGVAYYSKDCIDGRMKKPPHRPRLSITGAHRDPMELMASYDVEINKVYLSFDQLLLRGTSMVNTEWAYCVVVYVGHQTRLLKGSVSSSTRKSSKLENIYQRILCFVMMIMIVCVIFSALMSIWWLLAEAQSHTYLKVSLGGSTTRTFFVTMGSMVLLLAAMIPVDLIIIWEVVRTAESKQISWNPEMVHEGKFAESKSDQLIEDLAHITHIYSDKTGTLTQNVMTLKCLGFGNFGWVGEERYAATFWNIFKTTTAEGRKAMRQFIMVAGLCHSVVTHKDNNHVTRPPVVLKEIDGKAVLVMVEDSNVQYDAASPDELALVSGMAALGCRFSNRPSLTEIDLSLTLPEAQKFLLSEEEFALWKKHEKQGMVPAIRYTIRDAVPFDNIRKCMSMIIEDTTGELLVLCKGADSALISYMAKQQVIKVDEMEKQLLEFACVGLRTLLFAVREMSSAEYFTWHQQYWEASQLTENRDETVDKIVADLERDLRIVGSTAVEDLLQDDVGEVIRDLKEAGIVIWVLTGDKLETALSIGRSTNMITADCCNAILSETDPNVIRAQLDKHLHNCMSASKIDKKSKEEEKIRGRRISFAPSLDGKTVPRKRSSLTEFEKFSITVTGEALQVIYEDEDMKSTFYKVAQYANTVIACRTTQTQKYQIIIDNTKHNENSTSLAIGDGANDVGMILTADVGVGISGKEGNQACRSADFVIGQFRFLRQLLFVHGREALRKNSFLLYFCIFRNFSFSFINVIYNFYTGFSGVSVFNTWSKQIINLFFTSIPLILYVILDRELPLELLTRYPILYNTWSNKPVNNLIRSLIRPFKANRLVDRLRNYLAKRKGIYDPATFWGFIIAALWLSFLETLIILHVFNGVEFNIMNGTPINFSFNLFSQTMYVNHVLAVNAIVCIMSKTWFWPNHFSLWGETLTMLAFWLIVSLVPAFAYIPEAHVFLGTVETLHSSLCYFFVILALLVITVFPFWGYVYYTTIFNPSLEDQISLQLKRGTFQGVAAFRRTSVAYVGEESASKPAEATGFAFAIERKDALLGAIHRKIHKMFKTDSPTNK